MKKIPFAYQFGQLMKERGDYPEGYKAGPRGCIVHFTAGRFEKGLQDAKESILDGVKQGYTYLCIARTGELVQAHDVNKWGYHAGESAWHIVAKKLKINGSVSDDLIGIEMCNAGKLMFYAGEYYPYWCFDDKGRFINREVNLAQAIPESDRRFVTEENYKCPTGWYQKYTKEQEDTLIKTILWLYRNCPSFKLEYVLGHHEVAGVLGIGRWRKNDPGGSLSIPMDSFRDWLITNKEALYVRYGVKKEAA